MATAAVSSSSSTTTAWIDLDVSTEFLQRELAAAERALQHNEERRSKQQHQRISGSDHEDKEEEGEGGDVSSNEFETTREEKLLAMDRAASELLLVKGISDWSNQSRNMMLESGGEEEEQIATARACEKLGQLMCRHAQKDDTTSNSPSTTTTRLFSNLVYDEYLPLYEYIHSTLLLSLRRTLRQCGYPSKEACTELLNQADDDPSDENKHSTFYRMAETAECLVKLRRTHQSVVQQVLPTTTSPPSGGEAIVDQSNNNLHDNVVLLEFMRPFVERVRYHFVDASSSSEHKDGQDLTFSRIDRLPEWLFSYLMDLVFGRGPNGQGVVDDSPFVVITSLEPFVGPDLAVDFLNEVVRLVQWVFSARGFFDHPSVCGPHSKPVVLCNAIEQLIQFDSHLRSLVPRRKWNRLLSLMDIFVAGNDELLQWWLERERESLYYTIFEDADEEGENTDGSKKDTSRLLTRVSPRAEVFAALIRSVQRKALVFSFSGPYLAHVATPLCIQFLDAIHEKTNILKQDLSRGPSRKASWQEANAQVEDCIRDWIELINGTHMCAAAILSPERTFGDDDNVDHSAADGGMGGTDPDLLRLGQSLQHVESVLVEEFCSLWVEIVFMERAKLAVYLMKCSHVLCSADYGHSDGDIEMSYDLQESSRLLTLFLQVCDEHEPDGTLQQQQQQAESQDGGHALASHAPRLLRKGVFDLLASKFLEVALDPHEMMSPDILQAGCQVFLSDMQAYFGSIPRVPQSVLRLLDVAQVMALSSPSLAALGNALVELVQASPPLQAESFLVDEQIYNQAMSMIHAKGWVWIEDLNDILSILNRRRDLMNSDAF